VSRRLASSVLIGVLMIPTVSGCLGGGKHEERADKAESAGGEEREREEATRHIPARDRVAFYQLATITGIVRSDALARSPRTRASLRRALPRLERLSPRDPLLRKARNELAGAARALRSDRRRSRRAALRAADRVSAGLRSYTRKEPGAGALVPD
jgi:hypothetical protein